MANPKALGTDIMPRMTNQSAGLARTSCDHLFVRLFWSHRTARLIIMLYFKLLPPPPLSIFCVLVSFFLKSSDYLSSFKVPRVIPSGCSRCAVKRSVQRRGGVTPGPFRGLACGACLSVEIRYSSCFIGLIRGNGTNERWAEEWTDCRYQRSSMGVVFFF